MSWLNDLRGYGRFALGMRRYLRHPETVESVTARIRRNLQAREANFMTLLERAVFAHATSPYLALFKVAHCGLEDVRAMLQQRGLEATLTALRDAGVFVTFEEFKGRRPIVRDGREYLVRARDFDNPLTPGPLEAQSGGSTGVPTRVTQDLEFLEERAAHYLFTLAAHGILDAPAAAWRGVLPDGSGLNTALILARAGRPLLRWFTPTGHGPLGDLRLVKFRVAHTATVLMARAAGARIAWPELVDVEDAGRIAEWMGKTLRTDGKCAGFMVVSRAVRVALAAVERDIDLTGATFVSAGEPATPAKVQTIRSSGAALMTTYGMVEAGRIGMGCCEASDASDVHVMTDVYAVIASASVLPVGEALLSPLNLTVLMPTCPKVMINTEIDDCGILETRTCSCPIGQLGLTTHLRNIRSIGKLTTEGVSILGSEMTHILEEVLPARFGGTAIDYQLLEEEDAGGLTRVSLLVHPDIPIDDESRVVEAVLEAMGRESLGSEAARQVWSRTNTLRVRRMRPVLTAHGKMKPFHKAHRSTEAPALAGR